MTKLARKIKRSSKVKPSKKALFQDLLTKAKELHNAERWEEAEKAYQNLLRKDPRNDAALGFLGKLLFNKPDFEQAVTFLKKAVRIKPANTDYSNDLSAAYLGLLEWEEGARISRQVIQRDPENIWAYYNLGRALYGKGSTAEAADPFLKSIDLKPDFTASLIALCPIFAGQDSGVFVKHLQQMEDLLDKVTENEKMLLAFELGKAYDRLDEYDKAFSFMALANRSKIKPYNYLIKEDSKYIKNIAHIFTNEYLGKQAQCGVVTGDKTPIFIIGMPRSGTSLLEQILSCHPHVFGGGELPFFYTLASMYPFNKMKCSDFSKLGQSYLNSLKKIPSGAKRCITDKLPHNYLYAGLIKLALPNAKIIHCRRDPLDTCFSCFKQHFDGMHYYLYDLKVLGEYYLLYDELMRHWHDVMPGYILDVQYEDVVNDLEKQARRLLDFCGLPWDDACLNFHASARFVNTASRDQANKPIYDSSIGRWKHYEKHLQPLIKALKH